jgi:NAD(P)-dependent dehydrogenase (short-subunit alcohol dehydrogenase family)
VSGVGAPVPGATVIVSGGGSGIGAAIVALLAVEGWDTVAADVVPAEDVHPLDVRDEDQWQAVMEEVEVLGGVVNCAGIRTHSTLEDMELAAWQQVIDTNLTGAFLGTRAAFRKFRRQGSGGAIVNLGSVASFVPTPNQAHYVATKTAIVGLTKAAALEGARQGIRVNAVAPGPTMTPLIAAGLADPATREWLAGKIPAGRIGDADDVAQVVAFLFSDAARYVTGVTIPVDGGWLVAGPA